MKRAIRRSVAIIFAYHNHLYQHSVYSPIAAKEVESIDCAAALTLPATASLRRSTITRASFGVSLLARHSTSSTLPAFAEGAAPAAEIAEWTSDLEAEESGP